MSEVLRNVSLFLHSFFTTLWIYIYQLTRPLIKATLRRTTGLCELQRICYCEPPGAHRIIGVEQSLLATKNEKLKKLVEFLNRAATEKKFSEDSLSIIINNAVQGIYSIKGIRPEVHQPFGKSLGPCISIIWGFNQLLDDIESLKNVKYDAENSEHEKKLLELWSHLMPGKELESRVSNAWKDLGFQGDDPKTDFRGMGMLGLENLLYFAKNCSGTALHVLSHSHHPNYGYSLAIVGINLTHMSYTLWKDGAAKTHIYNLCHKPNIYQPDMNHFHRFYCYLFFEFDKFWLAEKPASIMEFSRVRNLFEKQIRSVLSDYSCILKLNFLVEDI